MPTIDDIVSGAAGGTDEVEIDFSGAVDFEPVPDGEYRAKVLSVKADKAKKSGDPKLVWTFAILDEPHVGRQVMRHTPTVGKGSGLAKQVMKALGFSTEPGSNGRVAFKPQAAVGKECVLVLGLQKDNPEYNEIKRVKPATGASGSFSL